MIHPDDRQTFADAFPTATNVWALKAHPFQLPPLDLEDFWLFMGGRGAGKSEAVSQAAHMAVQAGVRRIHLIAPTAADVRDVMIEGPSGLIATAPPGFRPVWIESKRRVQWPNGARAITFSAEEPESLRGPQAELVVIDELGRMARQQAVFDMAILGMRIGPHPRMLIATTPRSTKTIRALVRMKGLSMTTGTTFDNGAHLAPSFLAKVRELYEGTRLGLQELQGLLIQDSEADLFKEHWLVIDPAHDDRIAQVTVGVDPSGGADAIGIVAAGRLNDGSYAVLADRTCSGSPGHWGEEAVRLHDELDADDIVVEVNFGGQMAEEVVKQAAARMHEAGERPSRSIRVKTVTASRGKIMRAEPVSLLYEKGKVVHRPGLDLLEAEMLNFTRHWDRAKDGSPNRLDAMVWAISRLSGIVMDIAIA